MFKKKKKEVPEFKEEDYKKDLETPEPEDEFEEGDDEDEPKKKEKYLVVKELPVQQVRSYKEKDGTIVHLLTIEEALTEMFNQ